MTQRVVLGLIPREDRWFLQRRRPEAAVLPWRWEFPGGKVEPGEALEGALLRELAEEVDWRPAAWRALQVLEVGDLRLHPYVCCGPGAPSTALAWGWFSRREAGRLLLPDPNRALLQRLPDHPW